MPEGQFLALVGKTGVALAKVRPGKTDAEDEPGPSVDPDPVEPDPTDEPGTIKFSGLVHKPTPAKPDRGLKFNVPPGTYRRIDFKMDFVHSGWSDPPSGRHLVVWFVLQRNLDMILQLGLVGPPRSRWVWRHGFGMRHGEKPRVEGAYPFNDGNHRLKYTYEAGGSATLEVWRGNRLIINKTDAATVDKIVVDRKDEFRIGLGNPVGHADEPPTLGWEYRDIEVRVQ